MHLDANPKAEPDTYSETNVAEAKAAARESSDQLRNQVIALSHSIHDEPELGFQEFRTRDKLVEFLSVHGFEIETNIAGMETAFVARAGTGPVTVGICAEMDALPGVGHACGHNIIAASAMLAAAVLRPLADQLGITIKVLGTPAEEFAGGKIFMLKAGAFTDVHAAMMIHPSSDEYPDHITRAVTGLKVTYTGRSAHAAQAPEEGVNAADAATVAQVAVGLLRQHLGAGAMMHGIVDNGGEAANIVPGRTTLSYDIRANDLESLRNIRERIAACFEAGAIATGCEVTIEEEWPAFSDFHNDPAMVDLYKNNAASLGRQFGSKSAAQRHREASSTDMANVSMKVPSIHPTLRLDSDGFGNHHPRFAEASVEASGDRATVDGGLAMAWTVIDLALNPAHRARLLNKA